MLHTLSVVNLSNDQRMHVALTHTHVSQFTRGNGFRFSCRKVWPHLTIRLSLFFAIALRSSTVYQLASQNSYISCIGIVILQCRRCNILCCCCCRRRQCVCLTFFFIEYPKPDLNPSVHNTVRRMYYAYVSK